MPCLSLSEIQILHRNISEVVEFQNSFLRHLEEAYHSVRLSERGNSFPKVGQLFSFLAENLHVYSPTVSLHQMTVEIIDDHADNVDMAKFIKQTCDKLNEGTRRLQIKEYLIMVCVSRH